jgi:hypothetical protein
MIKLDYINSSQLSSIGTNRHVKQNLSIHDLKTRYMLWLRDSTICVLSNQSVIGQYLFPDILSLDFVYTAQLSAMGTNRHAKQNDVIQYLKTRYMLCKGVKYSMRSYKSKSDTIVFMPRGVKHGIFIVHH